MRFAISGKIIVYGSSVIYLGQIKINATYLFFSTLNLSKKNNRSDIPGLFLNLPYFTQINILAGVIQANIYWAKTLV